MSGQSVWRRRKVCWRASVDWHIAPGETRRLTQCAGDRHPPTQRVWNRVGTKAGNSAAGQRLAEQLLASQRYIGGKTSKVRWISKGTPGTSAAGARTHVCDCAAFQRTTQGVAHASLAGMCQSLGETAQPSHKKTKRQSRHNAPASLPGSPELACA